MACGAALTGLVNSFARVTQAGCPTAVEIRKGTWFAAGQSQLRRSGIVVETSGLTRAPQSQGQPAARARPALFNPIAEVETTDGVEPGRRWVREARPIVWWTFLDLQNPRFHPCPSVFIRG